MEKEKFRELIIEHKERFLARQGFVRREVQDEIARYLPQREIVIITGVRRSGKSSLMRLICGDLLERKAVPEANILYLNFEDERFLTFAVRDFEPLYETFLEIEKPRGLKYLFLDEIQNLPSWERWLNRLYEFEDVKIFITGSNAAILLPETATALTGRNRQIVTWPFSFREFLTMRGVTVDEKSLYRRQGKADLKHCFREYCRLGGFPEVIRAADASLLEQYYRDILYRDVIARYRIKNIREMKEMTLFLAANPGTIQSYRNLGNLIGVRSVNTVKNYLHALEDVYLFFCVDLFDYSLKRQIYNPSKVYCIDTALCDAVSFKFSRNLGHLYENMVFLELRRRGREVFYWKSPKGREIDFILKEGLRVTEAIQVSLSLVDTKTRHREFQALKAANDELQVDRLTLITEDEEGKESIDHHEINLIPLWKWLL
ncbi:MAG: ATP-binding protein [Deltaproteobacteria bacterium]|nr:ATP-binding protein [Deltaproteobacteria bacterium]